MQQGVADPLALLALGGDDWMVAAATIKEAQRLDVQKWNEIIQGISKGVGNQVAVQVSRLLRQILK